jgi:hypothetical protein
MRSMPIPQQTYLNPNDGILGGMGQKKKQFIGNNNHYIAHNAVIPPSYDLQSWVQESTYKPAQYAVNSTE